MARTLMGLGGAGSALLESAYKIQAVLERNPEDGSARVSACEADGSAVELCLVLQRELWDELAGRAGRYHLAAHPSLRKIIDVELRPGALLVVLEPAAPDTLAVAMSRGPIPIERSDALVRQLAAAIGEAHRVGLQHGMLVPEQVSLAPGDVPRIELSGAFVQTEPSSAVSTACVAPEARGVHPIRREPAADVYALGALWASLLLQEPFAPDHVERLRSRFGWRGDLIFAMTREDQDVRPPAVMVATALRSGKLSGATTTIAGAVPDQEDGAARVGSQLGRFCLEEFLGEGAVGAVYRALDLTSGQYVALKVLKNWALQQEVLRQRFQREARILSQVRSAYVANLVEANFDAGRHFIALEYVEGRTLSDFVVANGGRLEERLGLQIVSDMCRALLVPHAHGIVHRDIKPDNVLVVGSGLEARQIKVLDFGIAHAEVGSGTIAATQSGVLLGTPEYMSPEQCSGAKVGPEADVYALGATLYHLLAGTAPFGGEDVSSVMQQHLSTPAPDLSERAPVSTETANLVAKALEKKPRDRFVDAAEFLSAIDRVLRGEASLMAVHPRMPETTGAVYTYEFQWDLAASPQELWPLVANTERMNQVVGLPPVAIERVPGPDGQVRTILENRVMGLRLRWEDFPFEWVEGRRWGVLRVFEQGVMRWYTVELTLDEHAGGTRLTYRMRFQAYNLLGRLLVFVEMQLKQRKVLESLFARIDAFVRRRQPAGSDPFSTPHHPPRAVIQRIDALFDSVESDGADPSVVGALRGFVRTAPDVEVARLRPLAFARARDLDEDTVVEACLYAAKRGVFEVLWDVVCPLCRIPSDFRTSLAAIAEHGECAACNLEFPLDLAESIELVLRTNPELRPNELETYCVGGPAHSPHVAVQVRIAPGERVVLPLNLEAGVYRLRCTHGLPSTVELEVTPSAAVGRLDLVIDERWGVASGAERRLTPDPVHPRVALEPGEQTLNLTNARSHELVLRVERTATRRDALTVARATVMPVFRRLFPAQALARGRLMSQSQGSFVAMRATFEQQLDDEAKAIEALLALVDTVTDALARFGGSLARLDEEAALAVFPRPENAVAAVLGLRELPGAQLALAVHTGPVMVTTINDRMEYLGRAVSVARALALGLRPGQGLITSTTLAQPGVSERLQGVASQPMVLEQYDKGLWGVALGARSDEAGASDRRGMGAGSG